MHNGNNGGAAASIWFDLDNSPHVPFFRPIIAELAKRGCAVTVTSRECFETTKLLDFFGMPHLIIGRHYGKNPLKKITGLLYRTAQLCMFSRNRHFDLAVCHGSRSQMLASNILRIPLMLMFDYEGSKGIPLIDGFLKVARYMVPEAMENGHLAAKGIDLCQVYKYPGIKEDVYLYDFQPDPAAVRDLDLDPAKTIIVVRPPATQAHYHNPRADAIFEELLRRFSKKQDIQIVLLPRTGAQKELALGIYAGGKGVLTIPKKVVSGLDLIWQSDLVISGGGTMVREAAGLGIPAYSIFCGPPPDVDRYLAGQGRLMFIRDIEEIGKIRMGKRTVVESGAMRKMNLAPMLADQIQLCCGKPEQRVRIN